MILFRKISFWIALIGLLGAANLVLHLRASLVEPVTPPPITPATKPSRAAIAASGIVEALGENTNVGVPVSGLVTQVYVQVSEEVTAGTPLLQLDDRELQASLATQHANLAVAEAVLEKSRSPLARIEALHRSGVASDDDYDSRRNDVKVAEAQVFLARAAIKQTEKLIERLTVRAPISGSILQLNVRPGEFANMLAPTPVLVLGKIDEVQVRADVDEQIAPLVTKGSSATGYVKGDSQHPIKMDFVRIEPLIVPKRSLTGASTERVDTRVLQIIYRFPNNPSRPLYVGQQVDLFIEDTAQHTLETPRPPS